MRLGVKMTKLKFMVVPSELVEHAYVDNPVMVKICDISAMHNKGLLGDSGIKMAADGLYFYFEEGLAKELLKEGIVKEI